MIQPKLKICSMCPPENNLRHIWKTFRDEVSGEKVMLCKTHAMIKVAKKQIAMKQDGVAEKDEVFFKYVWDNSEHTCAECGKELKTFSRYFVHHILAKAKYKYFRWDIRNTIILCYQHHNEIESAISAPKLKVFKYCESVKKELLQSINMEYSPK